MATLVFISASLVCVTGRVQNTAAGVRARYDNASENISLQVDA